MGFLTRLTDRMESVGSLLCVGLDPDAALLGQLGFGHDYAAYGRALVDAVAPYACAIKPQVAYYSAVGREHNLVATIDHVKREHPQLPVILDAKRGDIGPTSAQYATEAFQRYRADAVTLNPYMGSDAIEPFLREAGRAVVVLAKTSNPASGEYQDLRLADGELLYRHVVRTLSARYTPEQLLFVVGATYPSELAALRAICPHHYFLVPGVGTQGGDVDAILAHGRTADGKGLVINVSRGIAAAASPTETADDYFPRVAEVARSYRDKMRPT